MKIPISYTVSTRNRTGAGVAAKFKTTTRTYKNYFFGQEADAITDMKQCSIVRGSTLTVEANRGYDVKNAEPDANLLQADLPGGACFLGGSAATTSYW